MAFICIIRLGPRIIILYGTIVFMIVGEQEYCTRREEAEIFCIIILCIVMALVLVETLGMVELYSLGQGPLLVAVVFITTRCMAIMGNAYKLQLARLPITLSEIISAIKMEVILLQ